MAALFPWVQLAILLFALRHFMTGLGLVYRWESTLARVRHQPDDDVPYVDRIREETSNRDSIVGERLTILGNAFRLGAVPYDQTPFDDDLAERAEAVPAMLRRIASVAVLVGLAGTLLGLGAGVSSLQPPATAGTAELKAFFDQMRGVLAGFGGAFNSALAGVAVAIICAVLAAFLDGRAGAVLQSFRVFARDTLIEIAAVTGGGRNVAVSLDRVSQALEEAQRGLPTLVNGASLTVVSANDSLVKLASATDKMIEASHSFASDVSSSGVLATALDRVEKLLRDSGAENRKSVEGMREAVTTTMEAITEMQRAQVELAEAIGREVVERPMEVAASRLLVSDREEIRRMRALVESIDVRGRAISATLDEVQTTSERAVPLWRRAFDKVARRS